MRCPAICYCLSYLAAFIFISQIISCKKIDDLVIISASEHRIVETINYKNGKILSKDEYTYHNGKLLMHYGYHWEDNRGWVKSSRTIYKCWLNNFLLTEYMGSDSNWKATNEVWAKFEDGRIVEAVNFKYNLDSVLMKPSWKWKYTYENERLILCEEQTFLNMEWISNFKTENLYNGNKLESTNSYRFDENNWILISSSEISYIKNQINNISNYNLEQNRWILDKRYEFLYSGQLISECNCFKPDFPADSVYLDCTTQYQYDEHGNLAYECCSSKGNMLEKFYNYEDSCGNFQATLGELSEVLNFPREIPGPAK